MTLKGFIVNNNKRAHYVKCEFSEVHGAKSPPVPVQGGDGHVVGVVTELPTIDNKLAITS